MWTELIQKYAVPGSLIFEIGVGEIETCRTRELWGEYECVLIEPHPQYYRKIGLAVGGQKNVTALPVAICDRFGLIDLELAEGESYLSGVKSPFAQKNVDRPPHRQVVTGTLMSAVDPGRIDVVLADMEGSEWFMLKHMISRPKMIVLEMGDKEYCNPNLDAIVDWMIANRYKSMELVESDFVYIRDDRDAK